MNRNQKIFILTLAIPLVLYGAPYAYAATVSSSYVVSNTLWVITPATYSLTATCNTGDYATGGGAEFPVSTGNIIYSLPVGTAPPTGWAATAYYPGSGEPSVALIVKVVCQTPITVAGIGVPEFGSLYAAIAIAAIAYFGLTLLRTKKTAKLPVAAPQ